MNKIKLFMLLILLTNTLLACDICNMNISLIPENNKSILSLNYRSRNTFGWYSMQGIIKQQNQNRHTGVVNTTKHYGKNVQEKFNVYDIKFRYQFKKRWSFNVVLPYLQNNQIIGGEQTIKLSGIGDPIASVNYLLFSSVLTNPENKIEQNLRIGGGVKLPFGKYNVVNNDGNEIDIDLQTGTGSVDYIISSEYIVKYKSFGMLNSFSYKINSANKNDYKYGNSLNQLSQLFYIKDLSKNVKLMPASGIYMEMANNDNYKNRFVPQSGGQILYLSNSLSFYFKSLRVGATYEKPIRNDLNGYTQLPVKDRWLCSIMFYFDK